MENPARARKKNNCDDNIPDNILAKINPLRARFHTFITPNLDPATINLLNNRRLTPDLIYEQVHESVRKGNRPEQTMAVYTFLMNHYKSVLLGETPVPSGSIFRKVPFL